MGWVAGVAGFRRNSAIDLRESAWRELNRIS